MSSFSTDNTPSSGAPSDASDAAADAADLAAAASEVRDTEADVVDAMIERVDDAVAYESLAEIAEAEATAAAERAEELVDEAVALDEVAQAAADAGQERLAEAILEDEVEVLEEAAALVVRGEELHELADEAATAAEEAMADAAEVEAEAEVLDEVADELEAELEADLDGAAADPAEAVADDPADAPLDEDELLAGDEAPAPISPYDRPGRWFVVHTQSGYEKKVKQNLEARISSMNMEGRIYEVVIPMEDVVEFKGGKKVVVQKKMFPGYLLVRCEMDDDSWYVIRNTPGVTGFVGQGAKPSPLPRRDVESFLQVKTDEEGEPTRKKGPRLEYEMGETVRIKEGPFADFSGQIIEINEDQLKVKVEVDIFGRPTPVELEFSQVAKL